MKITIIAVSVSALSQIQIFQKEYAKKYPEDAIDFAVFYVAGMENKYLMHPEILENAVREADVAIIDLMGVSEALREIVRCGLEECRGQRIVIGNELREYLRLGTFSMEAMGKMMKSSQKKPLTGDVSEEETNQADTKENKKTTASALEKMRRIRRMAMILGNVLPFGMTKDMKQVFLLMDYWQQATYTDIESFFYLILRRYCGRSFLPKEKPCTMRYGIYLKDPFSLVCEDVLDKYWKKNPYDKGRDTIAFLFYGHAYPNDYLPIVRIICEKLREKYNILPIAFSQNEDRDQEKLKSYLCQKKYPVSAVINTMPFRLGAGPMGGNADGAVQILKELRVPYIKPFCLTKITEQRWQEASAVNPGEFLISMLLPELDGGILTFPVGVMGEATVSELQPITERIDTLVARLEGYLRLQKLANQDKKLAFVFYNYPPGESNVASAAFLDTFASAAEALKQLKQAGYQVEALTAEQLREAFVLDGNCNAPQWSDEAEAAITYRLDGEDYPVKGIRCGNVFLGLQPLRQDGDSKADIIENYHDRNQEPPKAYQAFYRYIDEEFGADAVIHFGTHGTLEFLPGKDNGMMGQCWPDRLIGTAPHFYYYYIGNPSEAMIAKRRTHATIISYQAPALKKSGIYGELQELKETIAEYRESMQSAPERCDDLMNQIDHLAETCGCTGDLEQIEEYLYEYENSLITDGLHVMNAEEAQGLLHALDGEYVPVGTAGDVVKNPDILPSGRNLVQFDPRLVPTKTAYERGARAAQLAVEQYKKQTGSYPDTTAVILWGLETSRSQGETVGQILYYLGLRLRTDRASFDDRLEIIPREELGRPRMDVVIHMCGFFRDMYPNLVDNLNEMLQQILALDEPDEANYFAANTRKLAHTLMKEQGMDETRAWEMASCRIFGPKEGEYATRLTDVVKKGSWKAAEELGTGFTADLSYAYSYRHRGEAAASVLKHQYENVDYISQIRNNVEYELTDLDHYYEFYGGLSKAVENQKGEKPVMLVADTVGEDVKVQDIQEALNRGIRTRLLNPAWIEGMMRHTYHGVQQIEKRFENVMGFAASTDAVDSQTFSEMTRCYVADEELRRQMTKSNKWAYMKMMERLMEANHRGYYQATEEELESIREAYIEAEGEAEE